MKKHCVCGFFLILSILALMGFSVPVSAASNDTMIVKDQKDIYLHITDQNSSYVYLSAEAPAEWCGNLIATFHNKATGKNYEAEMNFIPEEWTSGIWLPFGNYTVHFSIVEDDGMCIVDIKSPNQKTFKLEKGNDLHISAVVSENPDYVNVIPTSAPDDPPPLPGEEYQDLLEISIQVPTEGSVQLPIPEITESSDLNSNEINIVVQKTPHSIVWGLAVSIILFTVSATILYFFWKKSEHKK